MSQPVFLDLFCCAGGASMGYHRAGFKVVGVDNKPQPNYPFEFHLGDAVEFLKKHGHEFYGVHASPPCQGYSSHTKDNSKWVNHSKGKQEPRLIHVVREHMPKDRFYVIENVRGAVDELIDPFMLCGVMFGLPIARHRYFECNHEILVPEHPKCRGVAKKYAADHGIDYRDMSITGKSRRAGCVETWKELIRMPWAGRGWEVSEAIPSDYAEYIGNQLYSED